MWTLKAHGCTLYVNHVTAEVPWSTKETSSSSHTKGSLKFKHCKLTIDGNNCATISKLGLLDRSLPHPKLIHRIIFKYYSQLHQELLADEYKHTELKHISGGCGTSWVICDLLDEQEITLIGLKHTNDFRILSPNEVYYKAYDSESGKYIDEYPDLSDEDDDE